MFAGMPTLSVRFDLEKARTGYECWKVLWRILRPGDFPGVFLFEGGSVPASAKPKGTFCITMQSFSPRTLERVQKGIQASPSFRRKCAQPPFAVGTEDVGAHLSEVGRIDHGGNIVPCASDCVAALNCVE